VISREDRDRFSEIWETTNRPFHRKNIPLTTENIMRFAKAIEKDVVKQIPMVDRLFELGKKAAFYERGTDSFSQRKAQEAYQEYYEIRANQAYCPQPTVTLPTNEST
jgi:hypothetical protein